MTLFQYDHSLSCDEEDEITVVTPPVFKNCTNTVSVASASPSPPSASKPKRGPSHLFFSSPSSRSKPSKMMSPGAEHLSTPTPLPPTKHMPLLPAEYVSGVPKSAPGPFVSSPPGTTGLPAAPANDVAGSSKGVAQAPYEHLRFHPYPTPSTRPREAPQANGGYIFLANKHGVVHSRMFQSLEILQSLGCTKCYLSALPYQHRGCPLDSHERDVNHAFRTLFQRPLAQYGSWCWCCGMHIKVCSFPPDASPADPS